MVHNSIFLYITFVCIADRLLAYTYDDHIQYEFEIDCIIRRIKITDEGFFLLVRCIYCIFFSCAYQKFFERTLNKKNVILQAYRIDERFVFVRIFFLE